MKHTEQDSKKRYATSITDYFLLTNVCSNVMAKHTRGVKEKKYDKFFSMANIFRRGGWGILIECLQRKGEMVSNLFSVNWK